MNDFGNELERLLVDFDELQELFNSISSERKMSENCRILGRCDFRLDMIKNQLNDLKKYL